MSGRSMREIVPTPSHLLIGWSSGAYFGVWIRFSQSKSPKHRARTLCHVCVCVWFHLICAVPHFGVLLLQHHPESSECHEQAVAHIPKHHREQERKCNGGVKCYGDLENRGRQGGCVALLHTVYRARACVCVTWVDLSIAGYPVSIDNILKACSESVSGEESRRRGAGRQAVVKRINAAATLPLRNRKKDRIRGRGNESVILLHKDTTRYNGQLLGRYNITVKPKVKQTKIHRKFVLHWNFKAGSYELGPIQKSGLIQTLTPPT